MPKTMASNCIVSIRNIARLSGKQRADTEIFSFKR